MRVRTASRLRASCIEPTGHASQSSTASKSAVREIEVLINSLPWLIARVERLGACPCNLFVACIRSTRQYNHVHGSCCVPSCTAESAIEATPARLSNSVHSAIERLESIIFFWVD
eukprot:3240885-Amphidinium_carterae.1